MAQVQQLTAAQQLAQQQQAMAVSNSRCQDYLLKVAYPIEQPLPAKRVNVEAQSRYEEIPQNTGLVTGFLLKIDAVVKNESTTEAMTLTPHGTANLLKNVEYFDQNNNQRINSSGWLLNVINSIRGGEPFLEADVTDSKTFGDNFKVLLHPQTIAPETSATVRMYFYIPLAVSAISDLRGAVLANTIGSQQRLNLTFPRNNEAFVATGANAVGAVYTGGTGSFESFEFQIYQHYYDQLPRVTTQDEANWFGLGVGSFIVPLQSLGTFYKIEGKTVSGLASDAEVVVQYGSQYKYLSTTFLLDNGGVLNTGSDIEFVTQRSSSQVNLNKVDPITLAGKARRLLKGSDLPKATYFISNYARPVYTLTYGQFDLVVKTKTVAENARLLVGLEYVVESQVLVNAGTLATS